MAKKWKWAGLILFFVVFTVFIAFAYEPRIQEVQGYSQSVHEITRTAERIRAVEWYEEIMQLYEYLSQWGEPYLPDICDDFQFLIDTDGYLYISSFPFYFCVDEGRLFSLDDRVISCISKGKG